MPEAILFPSGDGDFSIWLIQPTIPTSHYDKVNDPDVTTTYIHANQNKDSAIDDFTYDTIPYVNVVTSVEMQIHGANNPQLKDITANINLGGWQTAQSYDFTGTTPITVSHTWSGLSGTQADMDDFQSRVVAWSVINKNEWIRLYVIKVIVSYESSNPQHIGRISRVKSEAFFREVWGLTVGE